MVTIRKMIIFSFVHAAGNTDQVEDYDDHIEVMKLHMYMFRKNNYSFGGTDKLKLVENNFLLA